MPWALKISEGANRVAGTYHPTFLYESLWCVGVGLLVIWADRRFKLGHGRAFALYVAAYCAGRGWIEYMRVDEAHHVLGLRLNVWTAIVVFALAVVYIVVSAKVRPGREEIVEPAAVAPAEDGDGDADDADAKGTSEGGADRKASGADREASGADREASGAKAREPEDEADVAPQTAEKS